MNTNLTPTFRAEETPLEGGKMPLLVKKIYKEDLKRAKRSLTLAIARSKWMAMMMPKVKRNLRQSHRRVMRLTRTIKKRRKQLTNESIEVLQFFKLNFFVKSNSESELCLLLFVEV